MRRRDLFTGATAGLAAGLMPIDSAAAVPAASWTRLEDFAEGAGTGRDDSEALRAALIETPENGVLVLPAGRTVNIREPVDVTRGGLTVLAHGATLRIADRSPWSPLRIRAAAGNRRPGARAGLLRWYGGLFDGNVAGQWYPGHASGGPYPGGFPASTNGPTWDDALFAAYKSIGNAGLLTVIGFRTATIRDVTLSGVVRNGVSLIGCGQVAVSGLTASGGVPYEYAEMKAHGQRPIEAAYLKVHHGVSADQITGEAPSSVSIENVSTTGGCIGIFVRSNPHKSQHRERPHSNVMISNVSVRGVSRRAGWFEHPGRLTITNWCSTGEFAPGGKPRGRAGGIVIGSLTGSVSIANFSISHGGLDLKTPKRHGPYFAQSGTIWCSRPDVACVRGFDRIRDVRLRGARGTDQVDQIIDCDLEAVTVAPIQKGRRVAGSTIGMLRRQAETWTSEPAGAGQTRYDTGDPDLHRVLEVMRINALDGQPHILSRIDYGWSMGNPVMTTERGAVAGDVLSIRYVRRMRERLQPSQGTTWVGDLGSSAEILSVRQDGAEIPFKTMRSKKTGRLGAKVAPTPAGARLEIEHLPDLDRNGVVHLVGEAEISDTRLTAVDMVRIHARRGGDARLFGVTATFSGRPERRQSLLRLDQAPRRLTIRDCRFSTVFAPNVIEIAAGDATPRDYEIMNCLFADWGLAPRQGANAGWLLLYRKAHSGFLLVTDGITLEHSGERQGTGASDKFIKLEGPAQGAILNLRSRGTKVPKKISGGASTLIRRSIYSIDSD